MSSGFLQSDQNGQIGNPRTIRVAYRENLRLLFARFVRSLLLGIGRLLSIALARIGTRR